MIFQDFPVAGSAEADKGEAAELIAVSSQPGGLLKSGEAVLQLAVQAVDEAEPFVDLRMIAEMRFHLLQHGGGGLPLLLPELLIDAREERIDFRERIGRVHGRGIGIGRGGGRHGGVMRKT